jgi:radical SAM superfamily enzyme YgiQ (UPF0313 family)
VRAISNLDLLLINPGGRTSIYQTLASKLAAIEPPVWAGLIASYIRKKGFSVAILDANAEDLCPDEVADSVKDNSPLLTALVVYGHNPSASTQVMPYAGAICKAIKDTGSESKIVLVGGHVAALPEQTLREETLDYVCDGEGPVTILELLQHLHGRGQSLNSVRGLLYCEGNDVVHTSPAPLIADLDAEMPGIAWDLLPMNRYRAHNWHCFDGMERQPYAALYTSLGCPCHCSFCCIQAPFKSGETVSGYNKNINSYRLWNPKSVIAEIDILVHNYGIRNIKIADELFVLNPDHVNGICNLIISRGYDLNIWAYARVDTLKGTMLENLKRAGVTWLALGIESAIDRVRDDVSKGFSHDRIFNTVQAIRRVGINIGANYIFGLPEDDLESMQATLDLALALNTEWANFNCAMAYPGSQLYEQALREGWKLPEDWTGYSQYSFNSLPLCTRHLTAGEVLRFRDEAFHTYFTTLRYKQMIHRKFGDAALKHVEDMTRHRLRRKNVE